MWVEPKESDDLPEPQVLACITAIPGCLAKGGKHTDPKFKEFQEMVDDMNAKLEENPLQGLDI